MAKKRSWLEISREICFKNKSTVEDELWQELFDLAKYFWQLLDGCSLVIYRNASTEWQMKFFFRALNFSNRIGTWRIIGRFARERSSLLWDMAIEKIWEVTKDSQKLYRWEELERLLPKKHPYCDKARKMIGVLKKEKRAKKSNK